MPWSTGRFNWRRACASGACVEVAITNSAVHMRDSTDPDGGQLVFERDVWAAFLHQIRAGEFDIPAR